MKNIAILLAIGILIFSCADENSNSWTLTSPDGKLIAKLALKNVHNASGQLEYEIFYLHTDSVNVIANSRLGLARNDADFTSNLKFVSESPSKVVGDDYKMITGKKAECEDKANEKELLFENKDGKKIAITLRAYDNGIAFRYAFPDDDTANYTITSEVTEFHVAGNGKAWMQPYEKPNEWGPAYETPYVDGVSIGTAAPNEAGWCFPALFHANNTWTFISEANIDGAFYGAHLKQHAENGKYTLALPAKEEALGHHDIEPTHDLPWHTPWRLIMVGNSLGAIVESTLVHSLSEPSKIETQDWIKPGRSSWSWWSDHTSPRDYKKLIPFIDFSAAMGWEYSLIDANWNIMKNGNIEQLVNYAKSKNVGLFLWYNSGGPHTDITEQPRDIMSDPAKRKAEFKKLHDLGVKGVKVDFFNSDKPQIMQYYQDILKDAADQQIMVLFHGCTLPRGWERTYPNLMGMEGVRGAEQYWDKIFAENAQTHHTILPCTRNVMGSMDYTPVTFTHSEVPHLTTYAHELSLPIIFESGVTHYADRVSGYKSLPKDVLEFLKTIPTTWDETKFVQGYPGKEMVLARRKGNDWFIAGINGEKTSKSLSVALPFITEGTYKSILIKDGKDATSFEISKENIDLKASVNIDVLGRGGFVIRLTKE